MEIVDDWMPQLIALGRMKEVDGEYQPTDELKERCGMILDLIACGQVDPKAGYEMMLKPEPIDDEFEHIMNRFCNRLIEVVSENDGIDHDELANKLGAEPKWLEMFMQGLEEEP